MALIHLDKKKSRFRSIARQTRPGQVILDVGYADAPNRFIGKHRNQHVVGFDYKDVECHYQENIVGFIDEIKRKVKRKFDVIICGELIEHLENPYAFLRSLKGLLKPSGKIILTTPNPLHFMVLPFEIFRSKRFFWTRNEEYGHVYLFPPRWVEKMVLLTGYRLIKMKSVGFLGWQKMYVIKKRK